MMALPARAFAQTSAGILLDLARTLDETGAVLCGDASVARRHTQQLQNMDLIVQSLNVLSSLLTAEFSEQALSDIGLDDIKAKFAS